MAKQWADRLATQTGDTPEVIHLAFTNPAASVKRHLMARVSPCRLILIVRIQRLTPAHEPLVQLLCERTRIDPQVAQCMLPVLIPSLEWPGRAAAVASVRRQRMP